MVSSSTTFQPTDDTSLKTHQFRHIINVRAANQHENHHLEIDNISRFFLNLEKLQRGQGIFGR